MSGPGAYALDLYRGDTYSWRFVLWADEAKTQPLDLTDVEAAAQIRCEPGSTPATDLALSVTLPNIIDATLSAEASAALPDRGRWDLQLTYPGDVVRTVLAGYVRMSDDTTRPS